MHECLGYITFQCDVFSDSNAINYDIFAGLGCRVKVYWFLAMLFLNGFVFEMGMPGSEFLSTLSFAEYSEINGIRMILLAF